MPMQNERENIFQPLNATEYNIAGGLFRAYYDADGKLVFVLDFVIDDIKPNVLLVINPDGDRKWDDILMNDYGVDLETVRPKQDNKYQKLDIEYAGLVVYDELIRAYNAGADLSGALRGLESFHRDAARRAAQERLNAAQVTANRARETIDRTTDAVAELQARLKTLRARLAAQRKSIGREPTKQSAAKILRTESQIDTTNEKLERAKKRLNNAKRRLATAEDDAEIAQKILNKLNDGANLPAEPIPTEVAVKQVAPAPMKQDIQFTDIINTKVDDMADNNEEVKPLFDTDPEIIDEEIAFKPIDFGTGNGYSQPDSDAGANDVETPDNVFGGFEPIPGIPEVPSATESFVPQPVDFVPPVTTGGENNNMAPLAAPGAFTPTPIIEENSSEYETLTGWGDDGASTNADDYSFNNVNATEHLTEEFQMPAPVAQTAPVAPVAPVTAENQSMPEIGVAPIDSGMRPVSPVTGDGEQTVAADVTVTRTRPSFMYYVMLILLICMSVFTLWLYQKSTNTNLPELGAKTENIEVIQEPEFIEPTVIEPVVLEEIAPVVEPVQEEFVEPMAQEPIIQEEFVEPVPEEPMVFAEDVAPVIEEVVEIESVQPTESANVIKSLRYTEEVPEPVILETEEEILAKKPAYGVSQNEKMFVAAPEYETDAVVYEEPEMVVYNSDIVTYEDTVTYQEPQVYYDNQVIEYEEPNMFAEDDTVETCADGQYPSPEGCCTGEVYTYVGQGEYVCCVQSTGECFPPM